MYGWVFSGLARISTASRVLPLELSIPSRSSVIRGVFIIWRGILIITLLKRKKTRLNVHSARIPELFDSIPLREVREDEIRFLKWDRRRNELEEVEDRSGRIDVYPF